MGQEDLKTALQELAHDLRAAYRCESARWVMAPRGYDRYAKKIEDGELSPEMAAWFRNNVRRGEYME
jgi:hypothetical protein